MAVEDKQFDHPKRNLLDRNARIARNAFALIRGGAAGVSYPSVDAVPKATTELPGTMRMTRKPKKGNIEKTDVSLDA